MLSGSSEIRATKEGKRFLVVTYNNQLSNWGECLAAAYARHPNAKNLPTIAISDTSRFRVEGQPLQEYSETPRKTAVEQRQALPRRATDNDQARGIHPATPGGNALQIATVARQIGLNLFTNNATA